jgi:hypothetical protein
MGSVKSFAAGESVHRGAYPNHRADADVVLPCQYFESVGTRTLSSEQRLMLAVLADAINVLLQGHRVSIYGTKHNPFNEALSWVFGERRVTSLLSFDHVCDALGLDTGNLRKRLWGAVSGHGSNLRKLRLSQRSGRIAPTITRVRQR